MLNQRREEIELFFDGVLKDAKTPEQINGFYYKVVECLIISILKKSGKFNYSGLGFDFKFSDIEILTEIVNEHNAKMNVIRGLK